MVFYLENVLVVIPIVDFYVKEKRCISVGLLSGTSKYKKYYESYCKSCKNRLTAYNTNKKVDK